MTQKLNWKINMNFRTGEGNKPYTNPQTRNTSPIQTNTLNLTWNIDVKQQLVWWPVGYTRLAGPSLSPIAFGLGSPSSVLFEIWFRGRGGVGVHRLHCPKDGPGYKRDKMPVSDAFCLSDLPLSVEILPGCGVVEYFGRLQIKRRSSSFLIHRSSLVSSLIADFLVIRGVKQAYISNLLVTYRTRGWV